jgi:hypothetical protein
MLPLHPVSTGHTVVQLPQCALSVVVSTHPAPGQKVRPDAQQVPIMHEPPGMHMSPHRAQFWVSPSGVH